MKPVPPVTAAITSHGPDARLAARQAVEVGAPAVRRVAEHALDARAEPAGGEREAQPRRNAAQAVRRARAQDLVQVAVDGAGFRAHAAELHVNHYPIHECRLALEQ